MKNTLTTHGKCILIGEHAVVRGKPALVFPLLSKSLNLSWDFSQESNDFEVRGETLAPAFLKIVSLLKEKNIFLPEGEWKIDLQSDIPVRAGLGSSAALTVAAASMLAQYDLIPRDDIFPMAQQLENIFHGTSSGIDVAAVLEGKPILFQKSAQPTPLNLSWNPKLFLFDTKLRSNTKECVTKVMQMNRADLDNKMEKAVFLAQEALSTGSLPALAQAMESAKDCFIEWGLIPTEVQNQMDILRKQGALAVKPTGSGNGGFLLTLWENAPPNDLNLVDLYK